MCIDWKVNTVYVGKMSWFNVVYSAMRMNMNLRACQTSYELGLRLTTERVNCNSAAITRSITHKQLKRFLYLIRKTPTNQIR